MLKKVFTSFDSISVSHTLLHHLFHLFIRILDCRYFVPSDVVGREGK